METVTITPVAANNGLKNFIIGKMWVNASDGLRAGSIRISRDLPNPITLTADTTLFLSLNKKREGKNDADYNVSILLPVAIADALIADEQELVNNRKATDAGMAGTTDGMPVY